MAEHEPEYVTLKDAAVSARVSYEFLESMVNRGFIGTGVRRVGHAVMLDSRWIAVLQNASKRYSAKPLSEEDILDASYDMEIKMTANIRRQMENLEQGHQLMSEDQIKKNLDRYRAFQEFLLAAREWCYRHRPKK
jgi:hypothetical protein